MCCIVYLYVAAFVGRFDVWLVIALVSLAIEGFVVFVLNGGDCPLIHLQRKIGDEKPFFELFMPARVARRAIPVFAWLTWIALGLLMLSALFGRL
jgi:hypothetical protein